MHNYHKTYYVGWMRSTLIYDDSLSHIRGGIFYIKSLFSGKIERKESERVVNQWHCWIFLGLVLGAGAGLITTTLHKPRAAHSGEVPPPTSAGRRPAWTHTPPRVLGGDQTSTNGLPIHPGRRLRLSLSRPVPRVPAKEEGPGRSSKFALFDVDELGSHGIADAAAMMDVIIIAAGTRGSGPWCMA